MLSVHRAHGWALSWAGPELGIRSCRLPLDLLRDMAWEPRALGRGRGPALLLGGCLHSPLCVSPVPAPSVQWPPPSPSLRPALILGFLTPTPLHSVPRGPSWKGAPSPPEKAGGSRACGGGPGCPAVCVSQLESACSGSVCWGSAIPPLPQRTCEEVSAAPPGVATGVSILLRLTRVVADVGGSVLVHGESWAIAGDRSLPTPPHPRPVPPHGKERGRE